jgi:hypothetical protein
MIDRIWLAVRWPLLVLVAGIVWMLVYAIYFPAAARAVHHRHHHHYRHYDGVRHHFARHHGFICGATQRAYFGLPPAFNLALHWASLPHTTAHPGAVVVQRRSGRALGGGPGGHVSRIVSVTGPCRAIVTDERGTYERDICSRLVAYVSPR